MSDVAEALWWKRVRRAAKRKGPAGSKLMADWVNLTLDAQVPDASGFGYEFVDEHGRPVTPSRYREEGIRRQPIPPERFTEEGKAREVRRLRDELGEALGVGPMPADRSNGHRPP